MLTQYLRAFQLRRDIFRTPDREVLKHAIKATSPDINIELHMSVPCKFAVVRTVYLTHQMCINQNMGIGPDRYNLYNLKRLIKRPKMLTEEIQRLCIAFNGLCQSSLASTNHIDVLNKEWDNLIILDGCRYDTFERVNTIQGSLKQVTSPGSESWEYLSSVFSGVELHDTIYITANPHAEKLPPETFYRQINLLDTHWNEDYQTVLPESVVRKTIEVHRQNPNKRLVVHFMQPHFPFIGELGREFQHKGISSTNVSEEKGKSTNDEHVWRALMKGALEVSEEDVRKAYEENLEVTLPKVTHLLNVLDGKTVITSDHGNLIGERTWPIPVRGYGHPPRLRADDLITVPWLEVPCNQRRDTEMSPPVQTPKIDQDKLNRRLCSLGYKE